MNQKAKKTVKIVVDVLLWIFLVLALLMTILAFSAQQSNGGYPKLGNTCIFTVESDSMNGPNGFKRGDLIFGHALSKEEKLELKVGDVITFYTDLTNDGIDNKVLNTHRIIEVRGEGDNMTFVTQGDNREVSPTPDSPIGLSVIEAKWTGKKIGGVGSVIGFLRSSTGFLVCIVLPLAAFFIYELVVMILTINKIRNKGKKQITAEDEELIKQRAIEEYLAKQNLTNQNKETTEETVEPMVETEVEETVETVVEEVVENTPQETEETTTEETATEETEEPTEE